MLVAAGRRTGKTVSFPVVVARYQGERYLVSMLGEGTNWAGHVRAAGGRAVLRPRWRSSRFEEVGRVSAPPSCAATLSAPGARSHIPAGRQISHEPGGHSTAEAGG